MIEVKIFELKVKVLDLFKQTCKMKYCAVRPRECDSCIAMKHFREKLRDL